MSDPTTFDDHDPLAENILRVLDDFVDEIGSRGCTGHFDKVVSGDFYLKGKHLVQKPERFIEDHLVFPILTEALGYSIRPQPKQYAPRWPKGGGIPDFCITSIPVESAMQNDIRFFGEVKPPRNISRAREDMRDYLNSDLDVHAVAILTDGFDWELWIRPRNCSLEELEMPSASASLQGVLQTVQMENLSNESYQPHQVRNRIDVRGFESFQLETVASEIESRLGLELEIGP